MTNPSTTGEDFLVDGTSLMTYAYAIQTLAGRERLPPKIGDNIRIPYRHGRIWKPKTYDQQLITLGMWVRGVTTAGVVPSQGERAQFNTNLRSLKRLFGPTGRQLALQRTMLYVTGMETHNAQGEVASGAASAANEMDLVPATIRFGTFTVDIVMADPWWYGPQQVITMPATINNPGDVEATNLLLAFNGPLTNPMLTNTSVSPNIAVWYTGTIPTGQSVNLDTSAFTAKDGAGNSIIGGVSHIGSLRWMLLEPGNNVITLTNQAGGSVGTGSVSLTYSPPYT